ncbi:hypothetical protein P154DRAFT_518031 [Amniculicola lignicola CBS 123094]|uniref:Small secreted protein n=1 Tax=Amniculicola lignicola CBS 123094 TaxID=1392246 RepID=A0A6A5WZ21_9PLEO|nr:hypothetical protein P154DRAFT_518031 [Amniculicola lignicola CBS 123094]
MRFSTAVALSFAALTVAAPVPKTLRRRAVLADTTYDAISISGGVAGNAEAEALAVFSALDLNDLANIDPADIEFLGAVNDVANDAETDAFNVAIEAATGAEAEALQAGKTKNKVLKLMATKIELEAKAAQGEDTSAKLAEELTKLNNNIELDAAVAGEASTAVPFDATISGGGSVTVGAGNANNNVAAGDETEVATGDEEEVDAEEADADQADADQADAEEAQTEENEADAEEAQAEEAQAEENEADQDEEDEDDD